VLRYRGIDSEADVARRADIAANTMLGEVDEEGGVLDRPYAVGNAVGTERLHRAPDACRSIRLASVWPAA
jgi:hypothetical protein